MEIQIPSISLELIHVVLNGAEGGGVGGFRTKNTDTASYFDIRIYRTPNDDNG
jgi:hypothetical protein